MKSKKIFYQCIKKHCDTILSINNEAIRNQIEECRKKNMKIKIVCPKCGSSMIRRVIE